MIEFKYLGSFVSVDICIEVELGGSENHRFGWFVEEQRNNYWFKSWNTGRLSDTSRIVWISLWGHTQERKKLEMFDMKCLK